MKMMKKLSLTAIFLVGLTTSSLASAHDFCDKTARELADLYDQLWQKSGYADDYNEREFNRRTAKFEKRLNEVASNKQSLTCNFNIPNNTGTLEVYRSDDHRLQVFSWDEATGGTMHEYSRLVQYVDNQGKVHILKDSAPLALKITMLSIPTKKEQSPIYAINGMSVASTALHGQSVELLQINDKKLETPKLFTTTEGKQSFIDIAYDQFTLPENGDGSLIDVNGKTNEITVAVIEENTEEGYLGGAVTNKKQMYRFDGQVFKLVK